MWGRASSSLRRREAPSRVSGRSFRFGALVALGAMGLLLFVSGALAVHDEAFQDRLLAALAEETGTAL